MKRITILVLALAASLPAAYQWVLPVAAKVPGAFDTNWVTDLYILSDGESHDITMVFIPSATNGLVSQKSANLTITDRLTLFSDLLGSVFGETQSFGWVMIESDSDDLRFYSRTFNSIEQGTYGQSVSAVPVNTILSGQTLVLPGVQQNDTHRTNLGIVNLDGQNGSCIVRGFSAVGEEIFSFSQPLMAMEHRQLDSIYSTYHALNTDAGYLTVSPAANMSMVAYISVVDKSSGDAIFISGTPVGSSVSVYMIPVVTHSAGGYQTFWQSDLWALNNGGENLVMQFDLNGLSVSRNLDRQQVLYLADLVTDLYGSDSMTGPLWISANPASSLSITSRTYTSDNSGSYGQQIPGIRLQAKRATGSSALIFPVEKSGEYRTNFGVVNLDDVPLGLSISLFDATNNDLGSAQLTVDPGAIQRITDLPGFLGQDAVDLGGIRLEGDGAEYTAYLSIVDNRTGDAVYIGGQEDILTTGGSLADFALTTPDGWEAEAIMAYEEDRAINTMLVGGRATYLSFAVTNLGTESAEAVISVRIDGSEVLETSTRGLLASGETRLYRDVPVDVPVGEHQVEIIIDPAGVVDENNENNNSISLPGTWVPAYSKVDVGQVTPPGWIAPLVINYSQSDRNLTTLTVNTVAYVHWVITNYLQQEATIPFEVQLFMDGDLLGEWSSSGVLAADDLWYMDNIPLTLVDGSHSFSIIVDPYRRLWEDFRSNNLFTKSYQVNPSFFKYINLIPYIPQDWDYPIVPAAKPGTHEVGGFLPKGSPTYVDIALKNDGTQEITTPFDVQLLLDGTPIQTWTVPDLGIGKTFTFNDFSYTFPGGMHELKLVIDVNGSVSENNEADNSWSMNFLW